MTTRIIGFDADTRTVDVSFTIGEIVHKRSVNAVLTDAGEYDVPATAARVDDVGRGVAVKIGLGVISVPPIEAVLQPVPDADHRTTTT